MPGSCQHRHPVILYSRETLQVEVVQPGANHTLQKAQGQRICTRQPAHSHRLG